MIISGKPIQTIIKAYGEQTKVNKSAKPQSTGAVPKQDEVILSSQAQEFSQILKTLRSLPEVREDKVKELAERVAAGTYQVAATDIADKMIGQTRTERVR